jgi:hypothetical protein
MSEFDFNWKKAYNIIFSELTKVKKERDELKASVSRLHYYLRQYGNHDIGCDIEHCDVCTCGLSDIMPDKEKK